MGHNQGNPDRGQWKEHGDDVAVALPAFEAARRPILEKIVNGANASASWYENFGEHMSLAPAEFAMDYIMRSGRIVYSAAAADALSSYEDLAHQYLGTGAIAGSGYCAR